MLAYLSMLKGKVKKGKKPFFNFAEKGSLFLKPADILVTTRGNDVQAEMVLGQAKGKKKRALAIYISKKST